MFVNFCFVFKWWLCYCYFDLSFIHIVILYNTNVSFYFMVANYMWWCFFTFFLDSTL